MRRNLFGSFGVMDAVTSGGTGGDEVENEVAIEAARSTRMAELYAANAERTGRLAFLLTGDADLARDLAQEAFARLVTRLAGSAERRPWTHTCVGRWSTWPGTTGGGSAASARSSGERVPPSLVRPHPSPRWPIGRLSGRRCRACRTASARPSCSASTRTCPSAKPRRPLGCAVGTVKSLVSRGLESLRSEMGGDRDDG
jgi:hypothetical protein